jgi:hypothetical protein
MGEEEVGMLDMGEKQGLGEVAVELVLVLERRQSGNISHLEWGTQDLLVHMCAIDHL